MYLLSTSASRCLSHSCAQSRACSLKCTCVMTQKWGVFLTEGPLKKPFVGPKFIYRRGCGISVLSHSDEWLRRCILTYPCTYLPSMQTRAVSRSLCAYIHCDIYPGLGASKLKQVCAVIHTHLGSTWRRQRQPRVNLIRATTAGNASQRRASCLRTRGPTPGKSRTNAICVGSVSRRKAP